MPEFVDNALVLELRDLAIEVATDVASFLNVQVHREHVPDTKSSTTDLVTAVDREAEARIVQAIESVRPLDGFLGEEGTHRSGSSPVRWVIDPIDGTTNFVFAHPGFCVSIAAELDGVVVAGAVADPLHQHVFDAALGAGARCNESPIFASTTADLSRALVATGFAYDSAVRRRQAEALVTILPAIADIRRMGSAATDLCGVAYGRVDAYYEIGLNHWDLAAGALIAAEAGAAVWLPGTTLPNDNLIIAASPELIRDLAALIRQSGLLETSQLS